MADETSPALAPRLAARYVKKTTRKGKGTKLLFALKLPFSCVSGNAAGKSHKTVFAGICCVFLAIRLHFSFGKSFSKWSRTKRSLMTPGLL